MPENTADAMIFVVFGATGDLAKRMVLPAFYELHGRGLLPDRWRLIGSGRGSMSRDAFAEHVRESLREFGPGEVSGKEWDEFAARLVFAGGGFSVDNPGELLDAVAAALDEVGQDAAYLHYLAVPPKAFEPTAEALAAHKVLDHDARVVFEKPYGTSLESFRQLDALVQREMAEDQVYRIDHFLGKEAVQNLHVLRFANALIGNSWHAGAVAQVQIDVPETLGVADRAEFYDATGAYRDMIATHLFQVAAEVAMEPPASLAAEDLQRARTDVLARFRPLDPAEVVFGQFDGYRDIEGVADDSETDTFAAARLWIESERWHGVPFLLRSGKRLHRSLQEVSLVMRPHSVPFTDVPDSVLRLSMSGAGAIKAQLVIKRPGPEIGLASFPLDIGLGDVPGTKPLPPYAALVHDVIVGDRALFVSSDSLERAWMAAQPVLDAPPKTVSYAPNSWGPEAAAELTDGVGWVAQR